MILPVLLYGNPVLRKKANEIDKNYPELNTLISDMFETMYKAEGIGLAAPQIGKSIRLLIIDTGVMGDDDDELKDFRRVMINPVLKSNIPDCVDVEEGCLSLPGIRENVSRFKEILVEYYDENFEKKSEIIRGFSAIVVQHEFDHLEGKLFTDRVSGLKKHFVNKKLNDIRKQKVSPFYKVKF